MPTTDVTNTLVANISSTEQSSSNVPINRSNGNPAFAANVGSFTTYFALIAGENELPIPFTPCTQVYVKNLDVTKYVTVKWTPNNFAKVITLVLNPGDQMALWCNPAGAQTPGITEISLTPSAAGALVEYFLGG
jgi:hypothetical protein